MKKLLPIILLILTSNIIAQNVLIPDANFKAYLVGNPDVNTNGDDEIQESEAIDFTLTLDCGNLNILDLTGIEAFVNIPFLYCNDNELTGIDLSQNTKLKFLNCDHNQLMNLDLTQNIELNGLTCVGNQINSLDLLQCEKLKRLYIGENQISSIDLTPFPQLNVFDCHENTISNLDLSQNILLEYLNCNTNALTSINVSENILLEKLFCSFNGLSEIDVTVNVKLDGFQCIGNDISVLNVTTLPLLERFQCGGNQIAALDISQNPLLTVLEMEANLITTLDISQNPLLTFLDVEDNSIVSLDCSQNPMLIDFFCRRNALTYLNIANGNNLNIDKAWMRENDQLTCIIVDETIDFNNPPVNWIKDNFAFYNYVDCCFLDASIEVESNTLTAIAIDATYQWIDCNNSNEHVVGAINQSFTPTENGSYAVIIEQGGCIEVSPCFEVMTVSLESEIFQSSLSVFPNPTSDKLQIDLGDFYSLITVSVINSIGQLIQQKRYKATNLLKINLSGLPGLYFVELETDEGLMARLKVIKE